MTFHYKRELLLLRIHSAIADKEWVIARANIETKTGEKWVHDWHFHMRQAQDRMDSALAELQKLDEAE